LNANAVRTGRIEEAHEAVFYGDAAYSQGAFHLDDSVDV